MAFAVDSGWNYLAVPETQDLSSVSGLSNSSALLASWNLCASKYYKGPSVNAGEEEQGEEGEDEEDAWLEAVQEKIKEGACTYIRKFC